MAIGVLFNGVVYSIPETGEESWGEDLTSYFVAIPAGALQKSGGTFTLTADVNFGANFGLLSKYFSTRTALPSTAGLVRLAVSDTIGWRNNANGGNLLLAVNGSDQLTFNGTAIYPAGITALTGDVTATGPGSVAATIAANAVTDAKFRTSGALSVVGRSANTTGNVADISAGTDNFVLRRSGTALGFGLLVDANIDAAAAIAFSKMEALTVSRALVSSAGGVVTVATTTATEIGYVNGVTSAIQTQLDAKLTATLADGRIFVGNVSNVATAVLPSGDVTITNAGVTAIGTNKVTDAMLRQSTALTVIGRSANSTGNVADISAGTDGFVLRRSGTTLGFGYLVNANIDAAAAIDFSKLAALTSANILVGNVSNVAASVAVTGDVTISNAGVTAIGPNKVTNAMLATAASAATASYVALRDANANLLANSHLDGYTTTATAAGTTVLTVASTKQQFFTGSTTQTVTLPVASTLALGQAFQFVNNSSGVVTVQSSGANSVIAMAANSIATVTCILTSGTSAASWNVSYSTAAAGGGSVTSVAMTVPAILSVSGSPITTSGTLAVSLATQSAGTFFAGPTSGSAATPTFRALTARTQQTFTSSTGTYTTPAGVLYLKVRMVGGGGGGASVDTIYNNGHGGANGAASTFGSSFLTCNGGSGGLVNASPSTGGTATGGDINLQGGSGGGAMSSALTPGAMGGNTPFGGAGGGGGEGQAGLAASANTGSGGGGGGSAATVNVVCGGGGAAGGYCEKIITSPSATYAYAVGAGGAGNVLGTSGGDGAAGIIIVEEFYQ